MELGVITGESPYFPFIMALFLPAVAGIFFVVISTNVARKRIVLPATLLAFHAAVLLIILGDGRFGSSPKVLAAITVGLVANAIGTFYAIRFCTVCGKTTQRIDSAPWRCADCRQTSRTP
jgi:hypothetical protein